MPSFSGLALLDWSVSGGVGITNCVPLRLSGFFAGDDVSSAAGRFRFCGETGEDTISSMKCVAKVYGCTAGVKWQCRLVVAIASFTLERDTRRQARLSAFRASAFPATLAL